jgi:hypothetical protein
MGANPWDESRFALFAPEPFGVGRAYRLGLLAVTVSTAGFTTMLAFTTFAAA